MNRASKGDSERCVLDSVSWTWSFGAPPAWPEGVAFRLLSRTSTWGLSKWRARIRAVQDGVTLARQAARCDAVVLATVGVEALLTAALIKAVSRRTRVLVFDFLAPRRHLPRPLAAVGSSFVDRWLVIRSGDKAMLNRRFGVPVDSCRFLEWPVRKGEVPGVGGEEGYVYSAGWAHRDWSTLISALASTDIPAILAPGREICLPDGVAGRVHIIDMPAPGRGREITAAATAVAVSMLETDLPSGPLVLLDALALGKAVVASDVNGTRDYVRDEETALVVPPGDPDAMAHALVRLWNDPDLRSRLGSAAQNDILRRCSLDRFWRNLAEEACRTVA